MAKKNLDEISTQKLPVLCGMVTDNCPSETTYPWYGIPSFTAERQSYNI